MKERSILRRAFGEKHRGGGAPTLIAFVRNLALLNFASGRSRAITIDNYRRIAVESWIARASIAETIGSGISACALIIKFVFVSAVCACVFTHVLRTSKDYNL